MTKEDKQILLDFGQRLKSLRLEKNFSQEKLAFTIGIDISQISRIERGLINTSLLSLIKISNALQISPKELFEPKHKVKVKKN